MLAIPFTATDPQTRRKMHGIIKRFQTKQRIPKWVYGVVENVTKRNDKLYYLTSPHWLNVQYFDIRLMKEVAWENGPRVEHPQITETPAFDRKVAACRKGTELFCGSGNLSKTLECEGYLMKRYDRNLQPVDGSCYNTDWSVVSPEIVKELFEVTVLHMSPDCSTYSQLAGSHHGRNLSNDFLGTSTQAHRANGHAVKLFKALRARMLLKSSPLVWTAENPEATFHHTPVVKQMCLPVQDGGCDGKVVRLSFCAFGERVRKNTVFVTNSPTLVALAGEDQFYCTDKRCCFNKRMKHDGVTVRNVADRRGRLVPRGRSTDSVTAFPSLLCEFVAKCVDVDVSNACDDRMACDNAKCVFNRGHRGACSHMMVTA